MKKKQRLFFSEQVNSYSEKLGMYNDFKDVIKQILHLIVEQCANDFIVQARIKTISSFAEKILRQTHYKNPINEMTDICGARVVVPTLNEVRKVCKLIEKYFNINWKLSGDKLKEKKSSEFGYLSVHYSANLAKHSKLYDDLKIPENFINLKVEIQVRTFIQHTWAIINHDTAYKGKSRIQEKCEREFNRLAATLEGVDESFAKIQTSLCDFETSYGAYMSDIQIKEELERLDIIFEADSGNYKLAHRIGKMAMCIGEWEKAIKTLEKFKDLEDARILRDLGVSIGKFYPLEIMEHNNGFMYLKRAVELNPMDYDAWASLGGLYKEVDEKNARDCYKKAFDINPTNSYCLTNYLIYEIRSLNSLEPINLSKPIIKESIELCNAQIEVKINLPWAYFDKGLLNLFLGDQQESVDSYLMGIKFSTKDWMISNTLKTIKMLESFEKQLEVIDIVINLLSLGLAFIYNDQKTIDNLKNSHKTTLIKLNEPVVIISGSTNIKSQELVQKYKDNIINSFSNFKGAIISGGTRAGVCGLAADLKRKYLNSILTIGYVPEIIKTDEKYDLICRTNGKDFSVREAIHYWLDLFSFNIDIKNIRLIGIGGGVISSFEYRLALIFGLKVGIMQDSDGSAYNLLEDPIWGAYKIGKRSQIKLLKNEVNNIRTFLPQ